MSRRRAFLAPWVALGLLATSLAGAQERSPFDAVRITPLDPAAAAALPVLAPSQPLDPRAAAVAARLQQPLSLSGAGRLRIRGQAQATAEQDQALAQLGRQVGEAVEVHVAHPGAAPRLIKARVLHPATRFGARPDRALDETTGRAFLRANRRLLLLDDPDNELRLQDWGVDELGRRRLRFSHSHRGVPVWPGDLLVHLDVVGNVSAVNGAFVPTPRSVVPQPGLDVSAALARARTAVPGGRPVAAARSDLVIYAPGDRVPRLAWRFELPASILEDWVVVVDAHDGRTLTAFNQVMDANVAGSGLDLFGTTRALNVFEQGGRFYLVDTSKRMFDPTSTPPSPTATRGAIIILDARNQPATSNPETIPDVDQIISTTATGGFLADGVSAAFNFSQTYDYFLERHGRNSLDARGGTIQAIVRLGQGYRNAFFNPGQQLMGFGDAVPYAGALDVVAHELTHGVTFHTANLIYQDQPGALNEAFSDIFGEVVEARTVGRPDWITGTVLGAGLRNLRDPQSREIVAGRMYPAKMSQFLGPNDPVVGDIIRRDNGGVHINSTIVSHAFYLLVEGLSGGGIGLDDAARIFYRALTVHLVQNSQFVDARLAAVQSAEELFGVGSPQAVKTAAAFDAVEITSGGPTPAPRDRPASSGQDSTLFVFRDARTGAPLLGRLEPGLDPPGGVQLSAGAVVSTRPSVTRDGSLAAFVDAFSDMCLIATAGGAAESCLGFPGSVYAVAMAPDGQRFGFVFLDAFGQPDNRISVIDISPGGVSRTFTLVAPLLDGTVANVVRYADAMQFTADGRFLIYDALNELRLVGGSRIHVWSIYAIDLSTGQTLAMVPPVPGVDIGFPGLSHRSDDFLTFDAVDQASGRSTVFTAKLSTGDLTSVVTTGVGFAVPGYIGDDSAIVYSELDVFAPSGVSLWRQPLAADRLRASGAPTLWLADADFGVVYRRGALTTPALAQVTLSGSQLRAGQNLGIRLDAANPQESPAADLYVGVVLADGRTAMFFTAPGILGGSASLGTPAAFRSMQAAPPGFSLSLPSFFQFTIPATGVAPGTYQVFAALIRQGALADNRIDLGDILALDVKPLTISR